MTDEVKMIPVIAYRTPGGAPTCARDFNYGYVCRFWTTRKLGLVDCCSYLSLDLERENGNGWLNPLPECPVWSAT